MFKKALKKLLSKIRLLKFAQILHPLINSDLRREKFEKRLNDIEFAKFMDYLCDKPKLNAIQVGSNDGVSNDPLRKYIAGNQWSAILIEPVLKHFSSLKALYAECENVKVLNLAVSPDGASLKIKFYTVSESAKKELGSLCPDWYDQLGSFQRENIEKHLDGILIPFIKEIDVCTDTLENIARNSGFTRIDVLHIDAEGFDLEVLSSLNLNYWKPSVIIFEHKHIYKPRVDDFLKFIESIGYDFRCFQDDVIAYLRAGN